MKSEWYDASGQLPTARVLFAFDSTLFPTDRSADSSRGCKQGQEKTRLGAEDHLQELVSEMVREDLKSAERDELVKKHGFVAYDYHE